MSAPTNSQVIQQYLIDRAKIKALRTKLEELVAPLEEYQSRRETHLLAQDDPTIFDFMTDLYLNGRDGKATAENKKKDIGLKQAEIEKWLLKTLDKLKSKGYKTEFGTVYPTRKESVSVEDWDEVLAFAVLKPIEEHLSDIFANIGAGATKEEVMEQLRTSAHFEYLNKGVNKTAVLDFLGPQDEKDHSRPNPAPPGVKYCAIRTVGVRKS